MSERPDLRCKDVVELITEYLEGAMPVSERDRFEVHLSACPGCRHYLDQVRTTIRLAGRLTQDALPSDAWDELLVAFRDWNRSG